MTTMTAGAVEGEPRSLNAPPDRHVRLFGLDIADTDLVGAARWLVKRTSDHDSTRVAFLNAHCVNVAYRDRAYRTALQSCTRVFADGAGVRLAARASGIALHDNVNGTDLLPVLCREVAVSHVGLFFFGGKSGVAAEAARRLMQATPGLVIAGHHAGDIADGAAEAEAISAINASGADIVLIGLGVPLQELWIERNAHRLTAKVLVGVGGLFDYYSGRIPRAPLAVRRVGMEWAWRLAIEPRLLARRYLLGNVEFMARLACFRLLAPVEFEQFSSPSRPSDRPAPSRP